MARTDHGVTHPKSLCGAAAAARRFPHAGATARVLSSVADEAVEIVFPADLVVFCSRRRALYTRYSALRIRSWTAGSEIAAAALGDLALLWREALESPSPAALSWQLLGMRVVRTVRGCGVDRLHRTLSARQADVVLLRYRLGLTVRETSDLMGLSAADVLVASRAALRSPSQSRLPL
ncbi:hypothetical protein B9S64_02730 [Streptomyces sp. SM18]|nr:hypothetical protein B9S64_02730 [Streptomyces sp. SM18]